MTALSRREFGKVVLAGAPLAGLAGSTHLLAAERLQLGVTTDSFRELPRVEGRDNVDDILRAVQAVGASYVELALANLEPAPPSTAPVLGGSPAYPRLIVLTPQEIASTNARARAALRAWRLQTDTSYFEGVRARLAAAGLSVRACTLAYDPSFTSEEIDATFRQVQALGVKTIASPLTLAMASRLAPFAERHRVSLAIHNQVDGNAAGAIATADLRRALDLSPAFTLKLDVGHLTASNCDAVAELKGHLARVSHVILKDRLRNGGASQVFGEGDTPLKAVLGVLRGAPAPIPALVDYDYIGLRSPVEEVASALAFVKQAAGE